MTWYETEQIDAYLHELEEALDEWIMDPVEMRCQQATLDQVTRKLGTQMARENNPKRSRYIHELFERVENCEECIQERLR